jgi:hypothetical protein
VFIAFAVAMTSGPTAAADPPNPFPIAIGYVRKSNAVAAVVSKIPNRETPYMVFYETKLDAQEREAEARPTGSACGIPAEPEFRWKYRNDVYWNPGHVINPLGSWCMRIPIVDLPDHEANAPVGGLQRLRKKYNNEHISFLFHFGPLPYKLQTEVSDDYATDKNHLTGEVFTFDCLPVSGTDVFLFTLHRSQLQIWYGKGTPVANSPEIELKWSQRETIAAGFQEHFRVEGDAENYYFVTRSGRVFASLKPPKGRDMHMEVMWSDTKRPVRTLIADANTGRTFVFAPAPDQAPGHDPSVYFELKPNIRPKEYDAGDLPKNALTGRIKTVLSHVDFLIKEKKIVLPPPKP